MGRLSGGVDDTGDVFSVALEKGAHGFFVADVGINVGVSGELFFQCLVVFFCACLVAEKDTAQIVVDPDDLELLVQQLLDQVSTDETGRTGDENLHGWVLLGPPMTVDA